MNSGNRYRPLNILRFHHKRARGKIVQDGREDNHLATEIMMYIAQLKQELMNKNVIVGDKTILEEAYEVFSKVRH